MIDFGPYPAASLTRGQVSRIMPFHITAQKSSKSVEVLLFSFSRFRYTSATFLHHVY